jgi:hypothetical protein
LETADAMALALSASLAVAVAVAAVVPAADALPKLNGNFVMSSCSCSSSILYDMFIFLK